MSSVPVVREMPPFAFFAIFGRRPKDGASWRGSGKGFGGGAARRRVALAGRDFSMWTSVSADPKWWNAQNLDTLTPYDVFFEHAPPRDIAAPFHKQFAGRKDL